MSSTILIELEPSKRLLGPQIKNWQKTARFIEILIKKSIKDLRKW